MTAFLEQTKLFWQFVDYLVFKKNFKILNINIDTQEVLLKANVKHSSQIIRLKRFDIDWGNWIVNDLQNFVYLTKRGGLRGAITNIYFSTYQPVDEWKDRLTEHKLDHIKIFYVDKENQNIELKQIFQHLAIEPFDIEAKKDEAFDPESYKQRLVQQINKKRKEQREFFAFGKPKLSYVFIVVNAIMFLLLELYGGSKETSTLIQFGAKVNPLIIEGEWWRLVAPIFLHIGAVHFIMNNLGIYFVGTLVERIYGNIRFFIIYLISGIVGVVASFAFNTAISAGASGAIFGCLGALLYIAVVNRKLFFETMGSSVIFIIVLNLSFGFSVSMVDNAGHIGGLVSGFLTAAIFQVPKTNRRFMQILSLILLTVITSVLINFGYSGKLLKETPESAVLSAQQQIKAGNHSEARKIIERAFDANNDEKLPAEAFFLRSYLAYEDGMLNEAISDLEVAIKKRKHFHEAHFNLALMYAELGDKNRAKEHIDKALAIKPNEKKYKEYKETLENIQ